MEQPQVTWLPSIPTTKDFGATDDGKEAEKECCTKQCTIDYLLKYQIPLMLFTGIMFGFLVPFPGLFLDKSVVPFGTISVGCIFLLSGLKLNTDEICQAIKEWKGIIYGSFTNLCFSLCPSLFLAK